MCSYIKILKYTLSAVVMFYTAQITAATFTYSGDQLTGVNGVEALGETWNVTFNAGSFDDVDSLYGLSSPLFSFDDSRDLTTALAADMSGLGGTLEPIGVNGCSYLFFCAIDTPYTFRTFAGNPEPDMWLTGFDVSVGPTSIDASTTTTAKRDTDFTTISYAAWGISAVPIPAAVWLFGSGLIGLVGFAKRKKV